MSLDQPARRIPSVLALALISVAALALGITAQLLRQLDDPLMALGAATAPWLSIGFLFALWAGRPGTPLGNAGGRAIAALAAYLYLWLISYHSTFAIRESVSLADAWREAAPWALLAVPASLVLGFAAAAARHRGVAGDASLVLPIAWSTPELVHYARQGLSYAVTVGITTGVLALMPLGILDRREVRPVRLLLAWCLFAVAGIALLPVLRNLIHQ